MVAPTAATLKTAIISNLPTHTYDETNTYITSGYKTAGAVTAGLDTFLLSICTDISTAWATWQTNVIYSGDTVSGVGIGAWAGTGGGGAFSIDMSLSISDNFGQYQITTPLTVFVTAIQTAWQTKFNAWKTSYSFSGVAFSGTSTATSQNPGTFTAVATATTLNAFGTPPSGTDTLIKSNMTGFNFANSQVSVLTAAIGNGLESVWADWAASSTISPTATGVAAAGSGSGTSSSINGVIT